MSCLTLLGHYSDLHLLEKGINSDNEAGLQVADDEAVAPEFEVDLQGLRDR